MMTKYYSIHAGKTLLLFLCLTVLTMLTIGYSTLRARFGPVPIEAYYLESIEDYYRNAVPFEIVIEEALYLWQIAIPLIATFGAFSFIDYSNSTMFFTINKREKYYLHIFKNSISSAFISGVSIYVGYLFCLFLISLYFPQRGITSGGYLLFTDLGVSSQFFVDHYIFYYCIKGFFDYFLLSFELGMLAILVNMFTHKKYLAILIPLVYFIFGMTFLTIICNLPFYLNYFEYLQNKELMTFKLFIYHIVFLAILFVMLYVAVKIRKERT